MVDRVLASSRSILFSANSRLLVDEARVLRTRNRPCAFQETRKKKPPHPKRTARGHQKHSSTVTAITWRRSAVKQAPRVSPRSLATIDPGFVVIGLVQNTTDRQTDRQTGRQTDRQTDGQTDRHADYTYLYILEACSHPAMKRRSIGLGHSAPSASFT